MNDLGVSATLRRRGVAVLNEVEADFRARRDEVMQIDANLMKEYERTRSVDRTGVTASC